MVPSSDWLPTILNTIWGLAAILDVWLAGMIWTEGCELEEYNEKENG